MRDTCTYTRTHLHAATCMHDTNFSVVLFRKMSSICRDINFLSFCSVNELFVLMTSHRLETRASE